ncbi:MAG: hypothetical protein PUK59_05480 [Actinomycetaceae bacterium]|nr:hypothetical protein [Actinomycetaceae bacterium]MDY5854678.1 hypothetical protein [Arcanobacterium sp.]
MTSFQRAASIRSISHSARRRENPLRRDASGSTVCARARLSGVQRRVYSLLCALVGLLVLSSCESLSTIAIQPDGVLTGTVDISGDAAVLSTAGFDCQKIDTLIQSKGGVSLGGGKGAYQVKDQSDESTMHCIINFDTGASVAGTAVLSETSTSYVFSIPRGILNAANVRTLKLLNPTFTLSVAMPGNIISAPGATIQGNTATFTNTDVLVNGLNVEGDKTPPKSAQDKQGTAQVPTIVRTATAPLERSKKLGMIEWSLIGIGVFLAAVLTVGIRRQRRRLRQRDMGDPNGVSDAGSISDLSGMSDADSGGDDESNDDKS